MFSGFIECPSDAGMTVIFILITAYVQSPRHKIYFSLIPTMGLGGNQNLYIEEEQTTQWPKERVQKDKQRSTKHTQKNFVFTCQHILT
jgi:hypothetical protein